MNKTINENDSTSWELRSDQIRFDNMAWQSGIEKLSASIGDRMGYQDIPLQLMLRKLLVYGEGEGSAKHQKIESDSDSFATLVVQLPSCHEGGNLIIYHDGVVKHCHDFGKVDGTAAYLPHFAVFYADAEYEMEKVTKGYRLVLEYSISLPSTMRYLEKSHNVPLSEDLASAISIIDDENASFALLLTHDYNSKSIEDLGIGVLKGVDSVRFNALEEANNLVPKAKKLEFFVAQLVQTITFSYNRCNGNWEVYDRRNNIRWFTTIGETLGKIKRATTQFNFLNPEQETLSELWVLRGTKTEGTPYVNEPKSKYTRYAIVAWPEAQHETQTLKNLPLEVAVETFYTRKPIDAVALRKFLDDMNTRRAAETKYYYDHPNALSVKFCQLFCEMAAEAGDSSLLLTFFSRDCPGLGELKGNDTLIPFITKIAQTFNWKDFGGDALLACLSATESRYEKSANDSSMEMALHILDGLENGDAQNALYKLAVEKAGELSAEELCSSQVIGLLLKWLIRRNDKIVSGKVVEKFKQVDPSDLGVAIEKSLQYFRGTTVNNENALVDEFARIISRRIEWLKKQVEAFDKPFSWAMPDAQFCDTKQVEDFLRGDDPIMQITRGIRKFKNFQDASNYAAKWKNEKQVGASFGMEASSLNADTVVTIKKTRKWFTECQRKLQLYKAELNLLVGHCGEESSSCNKKRARLK